MIHSNAEILPEVIETCSSYHKSIDYFKKFGLQIKLVPDKAYKVKEGAFIKK